MFQKRLWTHLPLPNPAPRDVLLAARPKDTIVLLIFVWSYCYLNPWRPSICIVKFMNMHPHQQYRLLSHMLRPYFEKSVHISSGIVFFKKVGNENAGHL